jgi:hypothetical protein
MAERTRLTLDIDPALLKRLKKFAAEEGITIRELCLRAIERNILEQYGDGRVVPLAPDEVLTELWDNEDDAVYDNI